MVLYRNSPFATGDFCGLSPQSPGCFCSTPTPEVQLIIFYITLLSRVFLFKRYNFFLNFYRNREFLLCATISIES